MNKKLKELFEKGQFEQAILGKDDFYTKDYTWGGHDQLLVFYHLFDWLRVHSNSWSQSQIKQVFRKEFINNKELSEIDKGLESLHLIRNYCIKADGQNYWPIDQKFFVELIANNVYQFTEEQIERFNIKRDIDLLRNYLPGLPPSEELFK